MAPLVSFSSAVAASVKKWGPYYGVAINPAVVFGIIQKESIGGRVLEVPEPNGTTSWGPMGVNDVTARDLGVLPPSIMRDKPELGIWYGVKWFASLLKKFSGDVPRALSAYNAGAGNAVRGPAGRFPNQAYVDDVLRFAGTSAGGVVVLALVVVAGVVMLKRRMAA
jgi:soluble lytic murein transglycosylase-like protein